MPHPLLLALPVRLAAALAARAFFQPDEYYQALEPAYRLVFGPHAGAYHTWEWRGLPEGADGAWWEGGAGGIRSPLAAAVSAAVYWLLERTGCDEGEWMVLAPRLAQACIAASMDVAFVRLAARVLGPSYTNAALLTTLTSFFHFFTASRTLSNSTETALTAWALRWWPWDDADADAASADSSLPLALAFAATATVLRPSNAVIWVFLGLHLLVSSRRRWYIIRVALAIGLLASLLSFALDTAFYGTPTFTPLRFLHTNAFRSISLFYGANSAHFYLSQGLPILLCTQLPFFLSGIGLGATAATRRPRALRALKRTLAGTLATYSLLSHKEWRFIHPLLPVMHLFVALSLVDRSASSSCPSSSSRAKTWTRSLRVKPRDAAILLVSLVPAAYLTSFHGLGQTRVSAYLRRAATEGEGEGGGMSVGWLMPCHSGGWAAHLRSRSTRVRERRGDDGAGTRMWMITCEPPLGGQDPSTYQDETDLFYLSPCEFLSTRFPPDVDPAFPPPPPPPRESQPYTYTWPRRLVLFSSLLSTPCPPLDTVESVLRSKGYEREWSAWNTLGGWHEDERRRGRVEVWSWRRRRPRAGVGSESVGVGG